MVIGGSVVDEDVIEIDNHELPNELPQNVVHEAHECAWGVRKAEWHHKSLVKTKLRLESGLPLIPFLHTNLMVATP